METVKGFNLSQFPYKNFQKVSDLIYYEGPILSHFIDSEGANYFFYWVDYDNNFNRWLIFRVHESNFIQYLTGKENLLGLLYTNKNEFLTLVDIDTNIDYQNIMLVNVNDLPESYYPENDSYFTLPIPTEYKELVLNFQPETYLDILRQGALYLKLSYNKDKFQHTVDALEAGKFLNTIVNSYMNYVKAKFKKEFSGKYSITRLNKLATEITNQLKPRFVDVGFASFGVGLASDFINHVDTDLDINNWKRKIINHYSDDVLEIDYTSEKSIDFIFEGFTIEERNSIYKPIINLLKNEDYSISITDQNFNVSKKVKKATAVVESKLIAKSTDDNISTHDKELISLVIEKDKNKPLSQISAKSLQAGLLYSEPISNFFIKVDLIHQDDNLVKLSKPLDVQVMFNNSTYEVSIPELGIYETSHSLNILNTNLLRSLSNSLNSLMRKEEDTLNDNEVAMLNFIKPYL